MADYSQLLFGEIPFKSSQLVGPLEKVGFLNETILGELSPGGRGSPHWSYFKNSFKEHNSVFLFGPQRTAGYHSLIVPQSSASSNVETHYCLFPIQ